MSKFGRIHLIEIKRQRKEIVRLQKLIEEKDRIIMNYQQSILLARPNLNALASDQNRDSGFTSCQYTDNLASRSSPVIRGTQSHDSTNCNNLNQASNTYTNVEETINPVTVEGSNLPNLQERVQQTATSLGHHPNSSVETSIGVSNPRLQQVVYIRESHIDSLPQFDGGCYKNWVAFERTYGFLRSKNLTNDELISELKKSLVGEAYNLVEHLILIRADTELIINELREQYGSTDEALEELANDITAVKPMTGRPKHGIIELAIKVKAYVTHALIYGKQNALENIYLCNLIVKKMRPEHQDMWGKIKSQNPRASIRQLSELLTSISRLPSCKRPSSPQSLVHETRKEQSYSGRCCPQCKGSHSLEKCLVFLNYGIPQRYETINSNTICSSCLDSSDHSWQNCPRKKVCSIGGCPNYHHWMLHRFVEKA